MKEFIMKHPFITFLLADAIVCNVLNFGNNILKTILISKGKLQEEDAVSVESEQEETDDESSNDIQ